MGERLGTREGTYTHANDRSPESLCQAMGEHLIGRHDLRTGMPNCAQSHPL